MNVEKQISKLESLLGRIKRNAEKGRPHAASHAVAAPHVSVARTVEEAPHSALPPTARADVMASPIKPVAVATPPSAPVAARPAAASSPAIPAVAAATDLEDLDMMDADIVELGAEAAHRAPVEEIQEAGLELEASITEEEDLGVEVLEAELGAPLEESVPESAPRAAAPVSASGAEFDLEPVKTPPPESGRQIVAPPVAYRGEAEEADLTGGADVDSLLQPDLSDRHISKAPPGMPTMEQLGDVVELEGADSPDAALELEAIPASTKAGEAPLDDMELDLPKQEFSGAYDSALGAPAHATADLARHQQAQAAAAAPVAPARVAAPAAPSPPAAPIVVARPPLDVMHPAEVIAATPAKAPETFLELLDQSLSLKV